MKLHEAIAAGLALSQPLKDQFIKSEHGELYACTLGAAFYSGYQPLNDHMSSLPLGLKLCRTFSVLNKMMTPSWPIPPAELTQLESYDLFDAIAEMNDSSDLSREQINEWIKKVEEKYA